MQIFISILQVKICIFKLIDELFAGYQQIGRQEVAKNGLRE